MSKKTVGVRTKGMNRDVSVSAYNAEFCFENKNLRLSTNEGNTMMSWVNEKGPALLKLIDKTTGEETSITGIPIGTAVLNHQLVVFTTTTNSADSPEEEKTNTPDRIYVLNYATPEGVSLQCSLLYAGDLGFDEQYPLETLTSYEAENIQKVYWVDGKNQPRVVNIAKGSYENDNTAYNPFDFAPELELKESVQVKKVLGANGTFLPGVLQYAFTYYNKYGQESAVFNVSPLLYTSYADRGVSPEDKAENAFQITINNVDKHFDYVRIYSIQRTSLDGTPIVKRVQDVKITEANNIVYTDTGFNGSSVDPTELLYKGSEDFSAETIEQKDGTLFFGNIKVRTHYITSGLRDKIQESAKITPSTRTLYPTAVSESPYDYSNQLTSYEDKERTVSTPCGGFKAGDYYRLGVQFQNSHGKWSNPVILTTADNPEGIYKNDTWPVLKREKTGTLNKTYPVLTLPDFKGTIGKEAVDELLDNNYKRARAVVVFPKIQDRVTLCQGVVAPTLYTPYQRNTEKSLYAQSSWFFRVAHDTPKELGFDNPMETDMVNANGAAMPESVGVLPYTERSISVPYNPNRHGGFNIRNVEVQGQFNVVRRFNIDWKLFTFHSPDLVFDTWANFTDFINLTYYTVGEAKVMRTLSDIDLQTSSPTINNAGGGFTRRSFTSDGMYGIISGLFYDDFIVDDSDDTFRSYANEVEAVKWMVYLWNKSGSLNNDVDRPDGKGTATATLKKKMISNLRFTDTLYDNSNNPINIKFGSVPQYYTSDESTIVRLDDNKIYMGNVDTMLVPTGGEGMYFAFNGADMTSNDSTTSFTSKILWKTYSKFDADPAKNTYGLCHLVENKTDNTQEWVLLDTHIGDKYLGLVNKRDSVRMRYKTTPHLVCAGSLNTGAIGQIPIAEIRRDIDKTLIFGGSSEDAIMENTWVPCGKAVAMERGKDVAIEYSYGDTYYQRWDCLKTYPYNNDDLNQLVEIGSFMLETRVNIDGRYDRNRGQVSNINMSPRNFNLINSAYSQTDNFFSYKILDDSTYENTTYPNQITWSLTKNSGADVDAWTDITLANTLELDGDKGQVNAIKRLNDQLIVFQDTGISQVQYNENVQISSDKGVPIEIANSGKVQGKRYLSNTVGCSNRHSIATTPSGIYFMDNVDRSIYLFNGELKNLSVSYGMNSWCKANMVNVTENSKWTPEEYKNFKACYDKLNQDILFINNDTSLAFSERFTAFTSFYDYGHVPYYASLDNIGVWIKDGKFYKHNAGKYNDFFGANKPYWTTLVGNPEPQFDKIFTNFEFRAVVDGDGHYDEQSGNFISSLPFDYLEAWNEYQHGITSLANLSGSRSMEHDTLDKITPLKRRFRIWHCDIPRDNAPLDSDKLLNISRVSPKPLNRMRNPWIYIKLLRDPQDNDRMELHDMILTYYD